ncbi:MAG: hypothetical protein DYG89_50160 [Caldilinea sp. CFX5]|nr:hypothetical protein [Caldilinea sp. CFX5]
MKQQELGQHINILAWLHIVGHAIFLIIGGFLFTLLTSIGAVSGDPQALAILSVVGTTVGLLLALLALPGMVAGYGLWRRRTWGRYLAIVVGIFNLVNFPIGTVIGAYTLIVLLQSGAEAYFSDHQHDLLQGPPTEHHQPV